MPCLDPGIIEQFAARHGIIAGVCDAQPLARALCEATGFVPFVSRDWEKRTSPAATLPGARSIVVVGCGYGENKGDEIQQTSFTEGFYGELSTLGQFPDYHVRVKGILLELVEELRKHHDFKYKLLVDSPGLDERALALRAGLGHYGRHGLVISKAFGSRFHIGCLLTDIPLEAPPENQTPRGTGVASACPPDCRRCVDACPTGALSPEGGLDAGRCISYLTQKDSLNPEEATCLGNQLYGCDICQDACPFNPARDKTWVHPAHWLSMTDGDFTREYGHTAMLWRGADILR
ncbi:MAG: epoxyqueuosine reductase, partial [Defluviitaleaceae bacterium]|nr:epoxyqueuosine reductase [Defluviitaleaceae bacterium]